MQKKPPIINIIIATLLALSTALIGLLSGFAPNEPLPAATPYLRFTWPLLGIVTLAFIGLTIWQTMRQLANDDDKPISRSEHQQQLLEKQNRKQMLDRVRAFWIKGVFERSLHGAALIALGLKEQPEAIENPWHLVLQQSDQPEHSLPPGTHITQVYDEVGGELLILGEPGSGKTTLLLELARNLLSRAESDESHPMPMMFNLSSWAVKRQPLADWLVEEMNTKYQVPRHLGQFWVTTDQVLPLLDGLDEVDGAHRAQCVGAINIYRQEHGLVPMVVCSRTSDYLDLKPRLLLRSAVEVQPLTSQQIAEYLSSAGGQTETVRVALRDDLVLQELATTPLMLSVLTLAYSGMPVENLLSDGSIEMRRRMLFADYVHRMLQRRGIQNDYASQHTMLWLSWLARQLIQHNLTEFYIERMQPDWLPDNRSRRVYYIVCSLFVGLLGGLLVGLQSGLFGGLSFGLFAGLFFGLFFGLSFGPLGRLLNRLLVRLFGGPLGRLLVMSLGRLLVGPLDRPLDRPLVVSLFEQSTIILPVEIVAYSSKSMRIYILIGLLGGLLGGLFGGLFGGLLVGLLVGLFGVLLGGLLVGLSGEQLAEHNLVKPNQGIWLSLRNGLLIGLFGGLFGGLLGGPLGGLFVGPLGGLFGRPLGGLADGLFGGLFGGLLGGLLGGGYAFIQHFVLRWFLWYARSMPWNYPRFLDYAAERILLRKIGGGYIFVHRLLLEYFAALDAMSNSDEVTIQVKDKPSASE